MSEHDLWELRPVTLEELRAQVRRDRQLHRRLGRLAGWALVAFLERPSRTERVLGALGGMSGSLRAMQGRTDRELMIASAEAPKGGYPLRFGGRRSRP